jgi:hypothetical protein
MNSVTLIKPTVTSQPAIMRYPQHPPNNKWALVKFHVGDFNVTMYCLRAYISNFHEKVHNPEKMNEHSTGRRL